MKDPYEFVEFNAGVRFGRATGFIVGVATVGVPWLIWWLS